MLSEKQIRILELRKAGSRPRDLRRAGFSRSTSHDAYRRAERNLERIVDTIDLLVDRKLLSEKHIARLQNIFRKL